MRARLLIATAVAAAFAAAAYAHPRAAAKPLHLADATMIIEYNSTDRDTGIQVFLDGEPWTRMAVFAPNGRKLADFDAKGRLNRFGLTELFSESNEPEVADLPLRRFKRRFPEGVYRFRGTTIEGRPLVGRARFSHAIPGGPRISSPAPGSTVPEDNLVTSWSPAPESPGVDVTGYRVIVEREAPLRVFNADLPASVTSIRIPDEYLQPGTDYKVEVQAIDRSGNQTISERSFRVG